jgi:hypothetical protein
LSKDYKKKSIWFTPLNKQQTYLLFAIISIPSTIIIIYLQYLSLYIQNPIFARLIQIYPYTPPSFYGYFLPFIVVMLLMMSLPMIIYLRKKGRILTSIIMIIGAFSTFFFYHQNVLGFLFYTAYGVLVLYKEKTNTHGFQGEPSG